jgi:hypothetical protein
MTCFHSGLHDGSNLRQLGPVFRAERSLQMLWYRQEVLLVAAQYRDDLQRWDTHFVEPDLQIRFEENMLLLGNPWVIQTHDSWYVDSI